jgi:hypothetical protein
MKFWFEIRNITKPLKITPSLTHNTPNPVGLEGDQRFFSPKKYTHKDNCLYIPIFQ